MFLKKTPALIFLSLLCLGFIHSASAFITPLMPVIANYTKQGHERNVIMILDVKQQEQFFGACGYTLAVALKDKISPILFSSHALHFVESYFKPNEWVMYKNKTLLLFIPKEYLNVKGLKNVSDAGFNLRGWENFEVQSDTISGSELYTMIESDQENEDYATFQNLSKQSTAIICKTLDKGKYGWKIYAVGHGAPDAHQVCGLDLADFRSLLETLHKDIHTDFFIYQTCFGGSKNQLREIYKINQNSFKKFNYPIISGSLTNSVSFATHPDSGVSFKGIFSKVNNSTITDLKMRRLLKAVNQLNKCLDLVSNYHASNNLLLIRMPNSDHFEPVVDNKSTFKISALPVYDAKIMQDQKRCKCFLVDQPIIDTVIDLKDAVNFIVTSGISRSKHVITALRLPQVTGITEELLSSAVEWFNGLIEPQREKLFYIEKLEIGQQVFKNVTITQKKSGLFGMIQTLEISGQHSSSVYKGEVDFIMGETKKARSHIKMLSDAESRHYLTHYRKAVDKYRKKKHVLPLNALYHHEEVFSVV